jgi:hypothetical protein
MKQDGHEMVNGIHVRPTIAKATGHVQQMPPRMLSANGMVPTRRSGADIQVEQKRLRTKLAELHLQRNCKIRDAKRGKTQDYSEVQSHSATMSPICLLPIPIACFAPSLSKRAT